MPKLSYVVISKQNIGHFPIFKRTEIPEFAIVINILKKSVLKLGYF